MKQHMRKILLNIIDFVIVFCGCFVTEIIFSFFGTFDIGISALITYSLIMSLVVVLGMHLFAIYSIIWRFAGFRELLKCTIAVTGVWLVSNIIGYITGLMSKVPELFAIFAFEFSICGLVLSRVVYRVLFVTRDNPTKNGTAANTLIVGAGFSGSTLIKEMEHIDSGYRPVAVADDDKSKKGRYIHGIKVVGEIKEIPKIVSNYRISKIIIAMPSCDSKRRKEILEICSKTNCDIKILPYMQKMILGKGFLEQAKEIKIEDLLGRDPIKLDEKKNRELIEGKVCMVTGGGGSIGSELCRQIATNKPELLLIVDIYENNAYEIQQELVRQYGSDLNLQVRIASVRDYDKLDKLFDEFRPEIVFHAAAHKHVPLMEDSPTEAVKNNVFGTFNVAMLSAKYDVEKFTLVSTDKAVNPTNVMGATKRCCEMIVEYMKQTCLSGTEFVAVRFGNVLGSNGSVVPLFKEQIKKGGPVTVTHPDIIRYFMTIPEATALILQATKFANGGEIFVLDMGEPVKILSLAENVIKLSGKKPYEEIKIQFTGLRPGEKLYEELLMNEEGLLKTDNNKIFIGKQIELDAVKFMTELQELKSACLRNDNEACVDLLERIVPTFIRKKKPVEV